MEQVIQPTNEILNLVVQVIVIVVPILLTWFIRTYVRGSQGEREIAAIVRLSNSAIDYVENLDRNGRLNLPPDIAKGAHKLKLAGDWMEAELGRTGVRITTEEATQWISAEFQKRVGEVRMVGAMADVAQQAVDLIEQLEESGLVKVPSDGDRLLFLSGMAADWLVVQLAERGASVPKNEAMTWIRAELLRRLNAQAVAPNNVTGLAQQAVTFLQGLKAKNGLTAVGNIETDLVVAWMLTEAAKRGLHITPAQIAQEAAAVLHLRLPEG